MPPNDPVHRNDNGAKVELQLNEAPIKTFPAVAGVIDTPAGLEQPAKTAR